MNRGNLWIADSIGAWNKMSQGVLYDNDLSAEARLAWCAMWQICNCEEYRKHFHFSGATLAGLFKSSRRAGERWIKELEGKGYLHRLVEGFGKHKAVDYVIYCNRGGDIEQSKAIVKAAKERAEVAEFGDYLDKTPNVDIATEMSLMENEAAGFGDFSDKKPQEVNATEVSLMGEVNATEMSLMANNDKNVALNKNILPQKKVSIEVVTTMQKGKKEFNFTDIRDSVIYSFFGDYGFSNEKVKGDNQQRTFWSVGNALAKMWRRNLVESEIKGIVAYQRERENRGLPYYGWNAPEVANWVRDFVQSQSCDLGKAWGT